MELLYAGSVAFSRSSIVLFYRRIFSVDRKFLIFTWLMLALNSASCLAMLFAVIFKYSPVEAQWNVSMRLASSHIDRERPPCL